MIVKRISGHTYRIEGYPHFGWLPPGAATPPPTPTRDVTVDLEIQENDGGFLLICTPRDDSFASDSWHETIERAEAQAEHDFKVERAQWQAPK